GERRLVLLLAGERSAHPFHLGFRTARLNLSRRRAAMTTISRRGFAAGGLAATGAAMAGPAAAQGFALGELRGGIDAAAEGVRPGAGADQSRALRRLLAKANDADQLVFLGPGTYFLA